MNKFIGVVREALRESRRVGCQGQAKRRASARAALSLAVYEMREQMAQVPWAIVLAARTDGSTVWVSVRVGEYERGAA